ncbi:MAG: tRNA pseudouridine(55) synthase TruB [Mucinivorans sp.]
MEQILNIDKPFGWSSTDVVRKIKPMLGRAKLPKNTKIGHAGTLDPLATGVLIICIGKATKQVEQLQAQSKEYEFTIELGATTASFDLEHPVDARYPWEHITREMAENAVAALVGEQQQVPPVYSAKRIDGKRAYEYARGDQPVEMRVAQITIYAAEIMDFTPPFLKLRVECSKGTYVRSLARDLGVELGSGGYLTELRRTRSGEYHASDGMSIEQVENFFAALETITPQNT